MSMTRSCPMAPTDSGGNRTWPRPSPDVAEPPRVAVRGEDVERVAPVRSVDGHEAIALLLHHGQRRPEPLGRRGCVLGSVREQVGLGQDGVGHDYLTGRD